MHTIPLMKPCRKCGEVKPVSAEFFHRNSAMSDGHLHTCRPCVAAASKARYASNPEPARARAAKHKSANREEINARQRQKWAEKDDAAVAKLRAYRLNNREEINAKKREYNRMNPEKKRASDRRHRETASYKERLAARQAATVEKRRAYHSEYCRKWYRRTPHRKLSHTISVLMGRSLKGNKDGAAWEKLVGYTRQQLAAHIERQFVSGMSWKNYGEWHLDHVRPVSSFEFSSPDDPEFLACWAMTNLRPLWARPNMSKGGRLTLLL